MKVVLANGCFDPLHPGHVEHLKAARALGDRLIVALTMDSYVDKGANRPYLTWDERFLMLHELRCVDNIYPSRNAWSAISFYRPAVFVKGEDWKGRLPQITIDACLEVGTEIVFTTTPRFGVDELVRRMTR